MIKVILFLFVYTFHSPGACTEPWYAEMRLLRKLPCNFLFFQKRRRRSLKFQSFWLESHSLRAEI